MIPPIYFDGTRSIPLGALQEFLTGPRDENASELAPLEAYKLVAWIYRAVDLRANAVSSVPFALMQGEADVTDAPQYATLVKRIKALLFLIEAALCLYGRAYLVKESNRFGLNVTPRWLVPTSIAEKYDKENGLVAFERKLGSETRTIPIDEMVYFWLPRLDGELGAGTPPTAVALGAGNLLRWLDEFAAGFFKRGAVKATLLTVEGNPSEPELKKLEAWWKRMLGGVKKAWENVAIRASVKPVVIGSSVNETSAPELKNSAREDVGVAFGIPQTLLMSNAANYATASNDVLIFYLWTIIPECDRIGEVLNEQLYAEEGVTFEFQYKRLEVMQQYELQKAQAVSTVVGRPVLTVDEGRELMGYKPLGQPSATPTTEPTPEEGDNADAEASEELKRWQRKALNRLKSGRSAVCEFESDALRPSLRGAILGALEHASDAGAVRAVFANALHWNSYP